MNTIDLTPLYRNSVGFDRLASLIDNALTTETKASTYPPYNIEVLDENSYTISLAVAGFAQDELDIQVEKGVLSVSGNKNQAQEERKYLHQGIPNRTFERKFNLADYVEVTGAELSNGLLNISLVKEIPDTMKPKKISISQNDNALEHHKEEKVINEKNKDKAA
ncbi:Hsp20 family protein [Psychromonas algicola]|uniref:Hsp20 family protein n=1 Tax=Psychromonas algicola TaxID=2555642 RepID=UPI001ABB5C0D|nr:Hsp20 family protein [Psychromonas sp. RZ5]